MLWLKTKEEKANLLKLYLQIYHDEIVRLHTELATTDEGKANRINSKIMTAGLIKSLINLDEVELLGIGRICNAYLLGDNTENVALKRNIPHSAPDFKNKFPNTVRQDNLKLFFVAV